MHEDTLPRQDVPSSVCCHCFVYAEKKQAGFSLLPEIVESLDPLWKHADGR